MKHKNIIITAILVVAVGAIGFFSGMTYQKTRRAPFTMAGPAGGNLRVGNGQFRGGNGAGQAFQINRPVSGEISSLDGDNLTVKMTDGSSKIVILSDKTTVNKSQSSSRSDLKVGEKITVFGMPDQTGAVTAQSINLGESMPMAR